jgi:hypothetical protein
VRFHFLSERLPPSARTFVSLRHLVLSQIPISVEKTMSGFNWLQWISKVVSKQNCSRSRVHGDRSTRTTEALEERMLLSGTSFVPQIGTDDASAGDNTAGQVPNDPASLSTAANDGSTPNSTNQGDAGSGTVPIVYGPLFSRYFSVSSDETQTSDSAFTDSGSTDAGTTDTSSTDDGSTNGDSPDDGESVTILDLIHLDNSAAPQASRQFTFTVPENSSAGSSVGSVNTTDPDTQASITYAITSGNDDGAFTINPTTGQIRVANGALLNFEGQPTYSLTVGVTDNTTPDFSETVGATVNLTNVNEAPILDDTEFSVPENSAGSTFVGNLFASDPDVGSAFQFTIISGNSSGAFTLNPYTGKLTVSPGAALDFETRPNYYLTVQVADNGSPALTTTAQVVVHLTNVDDPPRISLVPANSKFKQGASAVRFATHAEVSDEDNPIPDFTGVVLSVSITDNRSNKDVLGVKDTGEKSKKIVVHGDNIIYGKTVIGTLNGGKSGQPTLSITLNNAASTISVNALLGALTFSTKDSSVDPRTIKLKLTSQDGYTLSSTSKTVAIKQQPKKDIAPGWGFY